MSPMAYVLAAVARGVSRGVACSSFGPGCVVLRGEGPRRKRGGSGKQPAAGRSSAWAWTVSGASALGRKEGTRRARRGWKGSSNTAKSARAVPTLRAWRGRKGAGWAHTAPGSCSRIYYRHDRDDGQPASCPPQLGAAPGQRDDGGAEGAPRGVHQKAALTAARIKRPHHRPAAAAGWPVAPVAP